MFITLICLADSVLRTDIFSQNHFLRRNVSLANFGRGHVCRLCHIFHFVILGIYTANMCILIMSLTLQKFRNSFWKPPETGWVERNWKITTRSINVQDKKGQKSTPIGCATGFFLERESLTIFKISVYLSNKPVLMLSYSNILFNFRIPRVIRISNWLDIATSEFDATV